ARLALHARAAGVSALPQGRDRNQHRRTRGLVVGPHREGPELVVPSLPRVLDGERAARSFQMAAALRPRRPRKLRRLAPLAGTLYVHRPVANLRQPHAETRAARLVLFDPDFPAMRFGGHFAERETQPAPAAQMQFGFAIELHVLLENGLPVRFGHAGAAIAH